MSTRIFSPDYITPRRLAEMIGITPAAVRLWILSNPKIAIKIGGRYHIHPLAAQQILSGVSISSIDPHRNGGSEDGPSAEESSIERKTCFDFA